MKNRKKKNGFTLVELLAVIIVLGIIAGISIFIGVNVIKNAKKKTYDTTKNNIEKIAINYIVEPDNKTIWKDVEDSTNEETTCVTVEELIEMGYFSSDVLNSEHEDGTKVDKYDYVNVIRDKNTKTITKNEFVDGSSNNQCVKGNSSDDTTDDEPTNEPTEKKIITINFDANGGSFDSVRYNYTGSYQTFTAGKTGYYKLEIWGAQGGSTSKKIGGYGGYSEGVVKLNKGDILYIYVGGQGTTITKKNQGKIVGGYNGGGTGISASKKYGAGGGGATHIATTKGLLSDHSSNYTSTVLMVAGGGGGAYDESYDGGNGGGISGTGENGGTQTIGGVSTDTKYASDGSFGQGGGYKKTSYAAAGGGGGLYGGSGSRDAMSGGGSGYINNNIVEDGSTTALSRTGNGYAVITYIKDANDTYVINGNKATITIDMNNSSELDNLSIPGVYKNNINFAAWQIDGVDITLNADYIKNLSEDVTTINLKAYYKENPTCTLSVNSSAVVSLKSSDAISYGISNNSIETFNNSTYTITKTGTVYGYVKDKYDFTGSCSMNIGEYGCTSYKSCSKCSCASYEACKCVAGYIRNGAGNTDVYDDCLYKVSSSSCSCASYSSCSACGCANYGCKDSGYTKINGSYCYKLN